MSVMSVASGCLTRKNTQECMAVFVDFLLLFVTFDYFFITFYYCS
jgi:hypothetical protein